MRRFKPTGSLFSRCTSDIAGTQRRSLGSLQPRPRRSRCGLTCRKRRKQYTKPVLRSARERKAPIVGVEPKLAGGRRNAKTATHVKCFELAPHIGFELRHCYQSFRIRRRILKARSVGTEKLPGNCS